MKRLLINSLLNWKDQNSRKPLIIQGARQVGKTYLLEQFGKKHFKNYHLFDFTSSAQLRSIFKPDLDPKRIIQDLSLYTDREISPSKDLIIFDEIQDCPEALTSLKYFYKEFPSAFICASGSLLGIGFSSMPFPVGKVERAHLYPMTFLEFLLAIGQKNLYTALILAQTTRSISTVAHDKAWRFLKYYFITGGLPEAVLTFVKNMNQLNTAFKKVRQLQSRLIQDYIDDITKHSGKVKAVHITTVLNSIPIQLARETNGVKKFIFKNVLSANSKFATLQGPIEWLIKAGLVLKVPICKKCRLPLKAYTDINKFNLYLFDVGLLGAMTGLSYKSILDYDYGSYKGYFAENYVLQQLTAQLDKSFYSWTENTSSIEFIIDFDGEVVPVEVKASKSTKAKSLSVFCQKYNPNRTVLFSGMPLSISNYAQHNYPLYLTNMLCADELII